MLEEVAQDSLFSRFLSRCSVPGKNVINFEEEMSIFGHSWSVPKVTSSQSDIERYSEEI